MLKEGGWPSDEQLRSAGVEPGFFISCISLLLSENPLLDTVAGQNARAVLEFFGFFTPPNKLSIPVEIIAIIEELEKPDILH